MASDWREHYLTTLGEVPAPIQHLFELDPEVAAGYTRIREAAYGDGADRLPLAMRELLFVIIDIENGNRSGAVNHLRAGIANGLTRGQFADALMVQFLMRGITPWGLLGHTLWDESRDWFAEPTG
jgi:hypothetical protein